MTIGLMVAVLLGSGAYFACLWLFKFQVLGDKGVVGPDGDKGLIGAIGTTGLVGDIGVNGTVGKVGEQGDQGGIGLRGLRGQNCWDVNNTGAPGNVSMCQGYRGIVGIQGIPGDQGIPGPQGASGGLRGWDRLFTSNCSGANDANGDGVCNLTDITGISCEPGRNVTLCRGLVGYQGAKGHKGDTGDTGPTGNITGSEGARGTACWNLRDDPVITLQDPLVYNVNGDGAVDVADCVGPVGATGATGDQGDIGAASFGPDGIRGPNGSIGTTGVRGINGTTNLTGVLPVGGAACYGTNASAECVQPYYYPKDTVVTVSMTYRMLACAQTPITYFYTIFPNTSIYKLSFSATFALDGVQWYSCTVGGSSVADCHQSSYAGERIVKPYTFQGGSVWLYLDEPLVYVCPGINTYASRASALPGMPTAAATKNTVVTRYCEWTITTPAGYVLTATAFIVVGNDGSTLFPYAWYISNVRTTLTQPYTVIQALNSGTASTLTMTCNIMGSLV